MNSIYRPDLWVVVELKYNDSENKQVRIYMEDGTMIIQDNGRGLTQKQFEKVLFSYASTEKESTDEETSGLGLNICQAIFAIFPCQK